MDFYGKSQKVREQLNSNLDKASLKIITSPKYTSIQNVMPKPKSCCFEIKKVFEKEHSRGDLLLTYDLFIPLYARLNVPDSVIYYSNKYATLKDQLLAENALKQTAELEAKYQTAKKEKQLLEKEDESKRKTNLLLAISALAFFIALIGFLIYRQQKIKNRQQEQEFQLKSAIAQIETQNQLQQQRLSISRDLHDNIGAQLTFIISSVDNIKYAFDIENAKLENKLKSISNFTQSTIVELRDTIWAMNSGRNYFRRFACPDFKFHRKGKRRTRRNRFSLCDRRKPQSVEAFFHFRNEYLQDNTGSRQQRDQIFGSYRNYH